MEKRQRPHSREKTTASGSAFVKKGKQVNTGSRPVGDGGRGSGDDKNRSYRPAFGGMGGQGGIPNRGGSKKLLILVVIIAVILFGSKGLLGGGLSGYGGTEGSSMGFLGSQEAYTQVPANDSAPDLTVSSLAREKRVTPVGNGRDTVTVMVYMCGTDLESKHGMATSDLQEMLNATIGRQVNVIVETGGCSKWQNSVVSSANNQIYKVEDDGLRLLEKNAGNAAMTNPKNLTAFIQYCNRNYPANRNILILWDHGGGSLTGYGYDEKNPASSSMTLSRLNDALDAADCVFDWIGFDACLMATLETALVCNSYADYLIASEETEPGTGWDYSRWLTALSNNTSLPTVELARTLIDDFVTASTKSAPSAKVTLSVIDLAELQGTVPNAFRDFSTSTTALIQEGSYERISNARAGARQFAQQNRINQVDLVDLALRVGTDEATDLANALQGCVKYNQTTMSRCCGVSVYFPYENVSSVKSAVASYRDLGIDSAYTKCIQSFASLEYGGQIAAASSQSPSYASGGSGGMGSLLGSLLSGYASTGSSTSPLDVLSGGFSNSGGAGFSIDPAMVIGLLGAFSGRSMPADFDWVDTELIAKQAERVSQRFLDPAALAPSVNENGNQVLRLTDAEWSLLQTVELNVFVEDGDGYIDLGLDNTFDWDGDDLLLEHDGTWLTLNGNVCAYYLVSDTQQDDESWVTVGRIPALLNDQPVNLQVVFDEDNPAGVVTGAYPLYDSAEIGVQAKGDIAVVPGDTIVLLCDYYGLDGTYSASYELGDPFTVPAEGLFLRNRALETEGLDVTYRLTDVYGNHYWVPVEG